MTDLNNIITIVPNGNKMTRVSHLGKKNRSSWVFLNPNMPHVLSLVPWYLYLVTRTRTITHCSSSSCLVFHLVLGLEPSRLFVL